MTNHSCTRNPSRPSPPHQHRYARIRRILQLIAHIPRSALDALRELELIFQQQRRHDNLDLIGREEPAAAGMLAVTPGHGESGRRDERFGRAATEWFVVCFEETKRLEPFGARVVFWGVVDGVRRDPDDCVRGNGETVVESEIFVYHSSECHWIGESVEIRGFSNGNTRTEDQGIEALRLFQKTVQFDQLVQCCSCP